MGASSGVYIGTSSRRHSSTFSERHTTQKIKFSIKDFFSKCHQICRKLRIWLHLLKKSLMVNLNFFAVLVEDLLSMSGVGIPWRYKENHMDMSIVLLLGMSPWLPHDVILPDRQCTSELNLMKFQYAFLKRYSRLQY